MNQYIRCCAIIAMCGTAVISKATVAFTSPAFIQASSQAEAASKYTFNKVADEDTIISNMLQYIQSITGITINASTMLTAFKAALHLAFAAGKILIPLLLQTIIKEKLNCDIDSGKSQNLINYYNAMMLATTVAQQFYKIISTYAADSSKTAEIDAQYQQYHAAYGDSQYADHKNYLAIQQQLQEISNRLSAIEAAHQS